MLKNFIKSDIDDDFLSELETEGFAKNLTNGERFEKNASLYLCLAGIREINEIDVYVQHGQITIVKRRK